MRTEAAVTSTTTRQRLGKRVALAVIYVLSVMYSAEFPPRRILFPVYIAYGTRQ